MSFSTSEMGKGKPVGTKWYNYHKQENIETASFAECIQSGEEPLFRMLQIKKVTMGSEVRFDTTLLPKNKSLCWVSSQENPEHKKICEKILDEYKKLF